MFRRVAKKMFGEAGAERGALVPGTAMEAMQLMERLGGSLWDESSSEDGDDDDAFLDELQGELRQRHAGGGAAAGARAVSPSKAAKGGGAATAPCTEGGPGPSTATAGARDATRGRVVRACTAPAAEGKAWLDAARDGRLPQLEHALRSEPSLLYFHGAGLGQTALHWAASKGSVPGHTQCTASPSKRGCLPYQTSAPRVAQATSPLSDG